MRQMFAVLVAACVFAGALAGCPDIVPRAGWGARPASSEQMSLPLDHIFIHHTAGKVCWDKATCTKTVRSIQDFHMDKNRWADIGYNFLIGGDGKVYEGRGWKEVGAHTYGYNYKSIGISFMGNFDNLIPNPAMLKAAQTLIQCGVEKGYIRSNYQLHGHRDAKCTACPGEALYKVIKTWPKFKGGKLPGYKC